MTAKPLTQETALKTLQALARARMRVALAEATCGRRQRAADNIYVSALRARDEEMTTAREMIMKINIDAATAQKQAEEALEAADAEDRSTLQSPEDAHKAILDAHKAELDEAATTIAWLRAEAERQKDEFLKPSRTRLDRARAQEKKARDTIDALTKPVRKAN